MNSWMRNEIQGLTFRPTKIGAIFKFRFFLSIFGNQSLQRPISECRGVISWYTMRVRTNLRYRPAGMTIDSCRKYKISSRQLQLPSLSRSRPFLLHPYAASHPPLHPIIIPARMTSSLPHAHAKFIAFSDFDGTITTQDSNDTATDVVSRHLLGEGNICQVDRCWTRAGRK